MKKILTIVIVLIIIGAVVWRYNSSGPSITPPADSDTVSVPASQTVVVSDKLSEYKNDELGFSVKYPTAWEKTESSSNVTFSIPIPDSTDKNTVGKREAKIDIVSGTCNFPPITTIKERSTLKVKELAFNMISLSNTVQGRTYFNRMYSLQKDSVCYFLTYSAITTSPTSKGYSGTEAQKIGARNLTLVDSADSQFKDMVKSFGFVVGPVGQDESTISPKVTPKK